MDDKRLRMKLLRKPTLISITRRETDDWMAVLPPQSRTHNQVIDAQPILLDKAERIDLRPLLYRSEAAGGTADTAQFAAGAAGFTGRECVRQGPALGSRPQVPGWSARRRLER